MKKALISAMLAVSAIASSLAVSASANAFTLVNYQSLYTGNQKCLALDAGTPTDGRRFIVFGCDRSPNQQFSTSLFPDMNVPNPIVGVAQSMWDQAAYHKAVSVANNATNDGASVILWDDYFTPSPGQRWRPDAQYSPAPECYRFINPNSGKVLGAAGGSMADGTAVIIWKDFKDPANHPDQYWCVR